MQIEDIEADLKQRIDGTRSWLADMNLPVIEGLEARGAPCTATAIELISDSSRKESDGVRFNLEFGRPDRKSVATAEVRISSTSSDVKDTSGTANGPYVAVYVLDTESGKGLLSYFEQFDIADAYFRAVDDSIQDWDAKWLHRLLRLQKGNTVFKNMKSL
jgi:hypothetical protein